MYGKNQEIILAEEIAKINKDFTKIFPNELKHNLTNSNIIFTERSIINMNLTAPKLHGLIKSTITILSNLMVSTEVSW